MPSVQHPIVAATMIAVAMAFGGTVLATPAHAAPQCTDIGPNTRMCTRAPGHTAIVTSPDPAFTNPWPGWGFGGLGYGLGYGFGLGGIWIGV
ncbi:MAG: hypothetical protein ACOYBX_07045 [Mycobacterium sp.]|jgi:hypothetical protein